MGIMIIVCGVKDCRKIPIGNLALLHAHNDLFFPWYTVFTSMCTCTFIEIFEKIYELFSVPYCMVKFMNVFVTRPATSQECG